MTDETEHKLFIPKRVFLSTHPEFTSSTSGLDMVNCFGMYQNTTNIDIGEMLLEIGVLLLMKNHPTADDMSLEELHDVLPSDYERLHNCQKPDVTMMDPVSFYLQTYRYPGLYKSSSHVVTSIDAIMYMAGEFIKEVASGARTMRELQSLFIENMNVEIKDQENSDEPHEQG